MSSNLLVKKINLKVNKLYKQIDDSKFNLLLQNYFTYLMNRTVKKYNFYNDNSLQDLNKKNFENVSKDIYKIGKLMDNLSPLISDSVKDDAIFTNAVILHGLLPKVTAYGNTKYDFDNLMDLIVDMREYYLKYQKEFEAEDLETASNKYDKKALRVLFKHQTKDEYVNTCFVNGVGFYNSTKNKFHINDRTTHLDKTMSITNKIMNEWLRKIQVFEPNFNCLSMEALKLTNNDKGIKDFCKSLPFTANVPLYFVLKPIINTIYNCSLGDNFSYTGLLLFSKIANYNRLFQFSLYNSNLNDNKAKNLTAMPSFNYIMSIMLLLDNYFTGSPKPTKYCIQALKQLVKLNSNISQLFID